MGDKDDFKRDFEEEDQTGKGAAENVTGPGQGPGSGDETPPADPMRKKGGSSTRILLLVLLLAVLVAAGYFYFGQDLTGPSQTQPQAKTEPRLMPVPQRDQAAPDAQAAKGEAAAEKKAGKPVAQPVPPRSEEPVEEKAAEPEQAQQKKIEAAKTEQPGQEAAKTAVAPEKTQDKDKPQTASDEAVAVGQTAAGGEEVAKQAEPAAESAAEVTKKAAAPVKSPSPQAQDVQKEGKYTLQAGAFVLYPNLVAAQEKVRRLGYEPVVKQAVKKTEVTRLRVGTFFPNQGEAKIAEIKALGAEPFFLTDGDLMVVYAGTFYRQDRARRFAERLAENGIHVEEENVVAELPLSILRFGDFASKEQAGEAAEKARAADLEVLLVKKRLKSFAKMTDTQKTVRLRVSPDVARIVAPKAPRELQLAAARGAVPLQGHDLVTALMFLCHGADESLRQLALQTFRALPASVLQPLVQDRQTHPQLLHFIARARLHDPAVVAKLLVNPNVTERTLALVARYGKNDVLEMLSRNDLALERMPRLAEMICANPAADRELKFRLGWREETADSAEEQKGSEPPVREEEDHSGQEERADDESDEVVEEEEWEGEEEIDELTLSKYQMALEMPVSEKIKMAMTGDKEWRTILLREANKLVSSAVLKNPRITEGEVLSVAKNRSASDELIRLITLNNEWLKNLEIKKALVVHPRTPLPKALRYMSVLTEKDIRHIAKSRNVSQVIANNARRILAAKEKKR